MMKSFRILFAFIYVSSIFTYTNAQNRNVLVPYQIFKAKQNTTALISSIRASKIGVCKGDVQPTVTFKASGGTPAYTFYFTKNGVSGNVVSAAGVDSASINIDTSISGTFVVTLDSISYGGLPAEAQIDTKVTVIVGDFPDPNFTFNNNVCSGDDVKFIPTLNDASNYSYLWDFGDGNTSTESSPTHNFFSTGTTGTENFTVKLTIIDNFTGCSSIKTSVATVSKGADTKINADAGNSVNYNGFMTFSACVTDINKEITFYNASSTLATNTNYKIDWGDGSPVFTATTWSSQKHTYNKGIWNLKYTVSTSAGCNVTRTYKVFVGSTPAVGLLNPGNTDICAGDKLVIPIVGTETNPPGTTYKVIFNDGTPPVLFNHPPPANIEHIFNKTSCGTNSANGTVSYPNSFSATIIATNPCSSGVGQVMPIYVTSPPPAEIKATSSLACVNEQMSFTYPTTLLTIANTTGKCTTPYIVWSITPNTNYTLISGTLGNDYGSNSYSAWDKGSQNLQVRFTQPGTYIVKLRVGSKCSLDQVLDTICVTAPTTPTFTLDKKEGCAPLVVNTNNTTSEVQNCGNDMAYLWEITSFAPGSCGTTASYTMKEGAATITNGPSTSKNTSIEFKNPGIYTVRLSATNNCGPNSKLDTIVVKAPPKVSINSIATLCQTFPETVIKPTATVVNCGNGSLTYEWSFPGATPALSTDPVPGDIKYLSAGNHTIELKVTNECGVSTTASRTFTIKPQPSITSTLVDQAKCAGKSSDAVHFIADIAGTVFNWTNSNPAIGLAASGTGDINSFTLTNASSTTISATITVTPTLNGCSGVSKTFTITVNPSYYFDVQPQGSTICLNGTPNTLNVHYTNGVGTPQYQWFSNTANSIVGATPIATATTSSYIPPVNAVGTIYYYCELTLIPDPGCGAINSQIVAVNVKELPSVDTQPLTTQNVCVGATIASLKATFKDGVGMPTYQWYSNTTNSSSGGTSIAGATLSTYTPPPFSSVGTYYYYLMATYPTTACGVVVTNPAEVVVVSDPIVDNQPVTSQTICQNTTPTTLTVSATGGIGTFNYQWYRNATNSILGGTAISGATNSNYTPPTATVGTIYYYCVITQTGLGCGVTSNTSEVKVTPGPTITVQPKSSTVCVNGIATTLDLTYINGTGSVSYEWFSNTINSTSSGSPISVSTSATYTPPTTAVGTTYYYCILTFSSGGCGSITSQIATVTVTPPPTVDVQPLVTQNICVGGIISSLTVTFKDGVGTPTYQWFLNTTNSNSGGTPITGATSINYTPPAFTTTGSFYYYLIATYPTTACGVVTSDAAEVVVVSDPVIDLQPLNNQSVCQNTVPSTLSVVASGGVGAYLYQWYKNTTNATVGGTLIPSATDSTYVPSTLTVGTTYYYCVVSQTGVGCKVTSNTSQVKVTLGPSFSTQPLSSTICLGSTIPTLSVMYKDGTGAPLYQWYENTVNNNSTGTPIVGATNSTYTPTGAVVGLNYYYCVITFSSGGCSTITSNVATLTINQYPVISDYNISIGNNTTFTVLPVDNPPSVIVPVGTTYTWSNPVIAPAGSITGGSSQTIPQTSISQTLSNITTNPATATYTVIPTSKGCNGSAFQVVVTIYPSISTTATVQDISCNGANDGKIDIVVSGGSPPYVISWTGLNGFTSSATTLTGLEKGTYNLRVTDNQNIVYNTSYIIKEPLVLAFVSSAKKDISCHGANNGEISVSVTGGTTPYTYSWTKDGTPFSTVANLTNLQAGFYELIVNDANSCTPLTTSYTITEPAPIIVTLDSKQDLLCNGSADGMISVNVTGGTKKLKAPGVYDYDYSWSGPNGFTSTNKDISNLLAGNYTLAVTDSAGCSKNLSVSITEPTKITINAVTTPVSCFNANDASITITVSGGIPPYQIEWDNFAKGTYLPDLGPGTYIVTVTDANSCVETKTISINDTPFMLRPVIKQISCNGAQDGSIALNISGGIPPIILQWDDNPTAGSTRNRLKAGTYTVHMSDAKCSFSTSFTIIEPQPLDVTAVVTDAVKCDDPNSGSVNLIVSGGSQPYTYQWSNGRTTEDLTDVPPGTYVVNITDNGGCGISKMVEVKRQPAINIVVSVVPHYNCATGEVTKVSTAKITGGMAPYLLTWSSGTVTGANNEIMETSKSGIYNLNVVDNLGCVANYSFEVSVPKVGMDVQMIDCNSKTYRFNALIPYGQPEDFTYTWNFGDGNSSTSKTVDHTYATPGTYHTTLVLKNGACSTLFTKDVEVVSAPVLLLSKSAIFCPGDSIVLHASGADLYRWYDGSTADSIVIKKPGDYTVLGANNYGCTTLLNFNAKYFEPYNYVINTDKDEVSTVGPYVQFWTQYITGTEYLWDFGDGNYANGYLQSHKYNIVKDGYYDVNLIVRNPNGCMENVTKRIWIVNGALKNTFSPNGDNTDDVYMKGWHIKIYNRNGLLLYDGTEGWDGTYNGKDVSNDTYFVVVYYSTETGLKTTTGYVTVIR